MHSRLKITLAVCIFLLLGVTLLGVQSTRKAARLGREAAAARAEADTLRQQLPMPSGIQQGSASGMDPEVWRERIRRLQAQIDEKDRLIAALQQKPAEAAPQPGGVAPANRTADQRRPWRDRSAWLEELKQTDPRRYEEIQTRRQEARQKTQRSIAEQATYYLDRDTSKMDETELADYDKLLGLLDETWRLAEQMQSDLPWEERRPLMRTLHENMQELTPLMESERDQAFYEVGLGFGYSESEAQEFTDYLNSVIEVTSMRTLMDSMHGGGRGGGPDGGGGGPGSGGGRGGGDAGSSRP